MLRPLRVYPLPGSHSAYLLRLLEHKKINCVLDVGAHYGEFGSLLRKIGFTGQILSFEPTPASFQVVRSRAATDKRWQVINHALGAHDGTVKIHTYNSDFFNSLLPPSGNSDCFQDRLQERGTETIEVRRLDSIFSELIDIDAEPRIFLKMDTQGYDVQVFDGSRASLPYIHGLQSELSGVNLYAGQHTMEYALSEYGNEGFHPIGFFPLHREFDRLTVIEWDCILMRKNI